jgi:2-polyprenyl-6-methoxyphenol hydroxylase-like FAD-dependent oxidoreductase
VLGRTERSLWMTRTAIVVGAGIGGLATAAGLSRHGWEVTVFEQATDLAPMGAGIALAPNGVRALD